MNEQELNDKIIDLGYMFCQIRDRGEHLPLARKGAEQQMANRIKSLCFKARDKWVLGEIEKMIYNTIPDSSFYKFKMLERLDDIRRILEVKHDKE